MSRRAHGLAKNLRPLIEALEDAGFIRIVSHRGHPKWRHPETGQSVIFSNSRQSDWRSERNMRAIVRRTIAESAPPEGKERSLIQMEAS